MIFDANKFYESDWIFPPDHDLVIKQMIYELDDGTMRVVEACLEEGKLRTSRFFDAIKLMDEKRRDALDTIRKDIEGMGAP